MSVLKHNIIANYASQLYVTAVGVVMIPLYIRYMGAEAYGLVGVFAMLQAWFGLLDMGLTPTMARETARFAGGALDVLSYRRLVRALEGVFLVLALAGGISLFLASHWIGAHWLKASHLAEASIVHALQLIGAIVALRWMSGLYRGAITGAERLVWLSGFNSVVATLRFVLVLPLLVFISASPLSFFTFQLAVAALELVGLAWATRRVLPPIPTGQRIAWQWRPLKSILGFSVTIAITSSVWVFVTQTDKLILSKILTLSAYGYFTVAVLAASAIAMLGGPLSTAIMPRMARLHAEGKEAELIALYRQATQMIAVVTVPAALVLGCFSAQVLWAWTGNAKLVHEAAPVLALYALGYGILGVTAFPYYLQYAKGDLRLHLIGILLFVSLLIPAVVWAATRHGAIGAGWAWLISNVLYLLLWTPLVHQRFAPGMHWDWLFNDVARPASLPLLCALMSARWLHWASSRFVLAAELACFAGVLLVLCYALAGRVRLRKRAYSVLG